MENEGMEKYKIADEKMMAGYRYGEQGEAIKTCDEWLSAWEDIKAIMIEDGIGSIDELQKKYQWTDFLSNYVQDLELALHNAGIIDKEYYRKRIEYCFEMLERCGRTDDLLIENTRRAIAESYFELGNGQEGERLYEMWLLDDPDWGWGYIGWSDCYHFADGRTSVQLEKAEEILTKALSRETLRDRIDVVERAAELYEDLGNREKAAELQKEHSRLSRLEKGFLYGPKQTPVRVEKIGRNDPCPCGSGKKYKKCCGK